LGFFLTIIYVLIIMIRPQEFVTSIRAWPILDVMAILSLGASFIEGRINGTRLGRSASCKFVLLFLIWCGLSHIRMGNTGLILDSWIDFSKIAIVFYLVVLNVDTFQRLKTFTWVMILSTTVLALQGIWLFYTGSAFGSAEAVVRGELLQVKGIGVFSDPNDLGLHLITWVPLLLPAFHRPFLSPTMWTGLLFIVPIITGLALTRSRGSMLGAAMVFWFYFYKRVGKFISIIGLVLILAAIMTLPRMSSISTKEASARSRMEHWSEGMKLFRWRPITGVGHHQFIEHHVQTAHNSFVLVFPNWV
jgi:putative inorganic carbon (HCO3(-)) transporter